MGKRDYLRFLLCRKMKEAGGEVDAADLSEKEIRIVRGLIRDGLIDVKLCVREEARESTKEKKVMRDNLTAFEIILATLVSVIMSIWINHLIS